MDLVRVQVQRRPAADGRPVERLAVRGGPDAGVLAARGEVVALERVEEGHVGRRHDVADDLADAFAVRLGGDLDHRRHERLIERDLEHPLDLGDGPLDDDARRRQAGRQALGQRLDVAAEVRRVGVQPRDERLERSGVSAGWNWVSHGRSCCGPLIWSTVLSW